MLLKRLIVCLDVRDGKTTKGIRFKGNTDMGDPVKMAEQYYADGIDELVFYDITASSERRGVMLQVVNAVARQIFVPFTVGGGVRNLDDIRAILTAGAEKVSLNSGAVRNPSILKKASEQFGSQCIVLAIDALADPRMPCGYRIVIDGGRVPTEWDALQWVHRGVELGVGEIVVNSVDKDGTRAGYELTLTRMISEQVPVPVVASGGAGTVQHIQAVLEEGKADAALVASLLHYGTYRIAEIKDALQHAGIAMR